MNIGMILDETFPPDPRVENEAISLIDAGHKVTLFCLTYGNEQQSEIINGITVKRYLSNQLEYKLSALAYTVPFYTFLMKKKVKKFIRAHKIDAIHIHDIRIADAVFKANKNTMLPVILDLHENRPEIMQFYPHLSKFPGKYIISPKKWKQKEEIFINKADKV
ncbi:glycosyltransferase family 4 protein, partial [Polaribacter sp.]|uniref:glycosyltransferase family 4 protein n=1 Tax=Polaribacter sp. TaxID=1920175 RepID=UPI003F6B7499